ncbi:MAG: ferredoxin--NADP reductase [Acidimicrobiales bacterium]
MRVGDIDIEIPDGMPWSRGVRDRRLRRVDRYDRRAQLTAYETLTPTGTVRLTFRVVDDRRFRFNPGQFVGIQADVPNFGVRKTPYCIISAPGEDRAFQLLVRLVPEGPLSYYLADLSIGDVIHFRGPNGRSMVPKEDDTELVLLATGVGVGPFLSLALHLLGQGFDRRIQLLWGLRLKEDICLLEELDAISRSEAFSYRISLSRPEGEWAGLRGRLTESVPPLLGSLDNKHFYLVGNGAMIEEMGAALSDLGVSKNLIYEERYFNVKYRPDPAVVDEIRRRFVARDLASPLEIREAIERKQLEWRQARGGG